ncbi:DUF2474 family protein [Luteibacter jiangsuensis]|uniref:DUF2474 family protein n=1 Tax=Luteibacter jiangsuensis TaxID=637577 RepID=A0ABX0Q885_9GAMM|nr:DUF2474 family protein [Luteibacter jiangsuensis]NID05832.1 DUF2474 family protein [Luteibacter jiangsuensis]
MSERSRWRQAAWFVVLYLGGVIAVGLIALLFRLLVPR